MRITLICISLRGGGTERIVSRTANYLSATHDVSIVTLAPNNPFYALDSGVAVIQPEYLKRGPFRLSRIIRQIRHLYSAVRDIRPDLCMVFGEDIAGLASVLTRVARASTVWIFFRGRPDRSIKGIKGRINRVLCRCSQKLFVQTTAAKMELSQYYPPKKLTVWPNPIDIPDVASPARQRERLIANIGLIGRQKNQHALVRIFQNLNATATGSWNLLFIGDGPDRTDLEARAHNPQGPGKIFFAGEKKEVSSYLDRAAIFAFTSLSEGFPNALAEAMAAGCACISFDCSAGPAELIDHEVNGFLVKAGDEMEYARLLQRLIDEPTLREIFSRNARESIRKFDSTAVLKLMDSMMNELGRKSSCARAIGRGAR